MEGKVLDFWVDFNEQVTNVSVATGGGILLLEQLKLFKIFGAEKLSVWSKIFFCLAKP